MKNKSILFAILPLLALALLNSCKKQEDIIEPGKSVHALAREGNPFSFRPLNMTPAALLAFSEDGEYEKIDMGRYALGNAVKDYIDSNISDYIVNAAKASPAGSVGVDDVFAQFPEFATQVQNALASTTIEGIPYDFSTYANIKNVMVRNGVQYFLEFSVPNMDSVDLGQLPVLSPSSDVAETSSDEDISADQVAAWHLTPKVGQETKNRATLIKVVENEAFASRIPFISITLNSRLAINGPTTALQKGTSTNPWTLRDEIHIKGLKINTRFEKSGASQVCFNGYYHWSNGGAWKSTDYNLVVSQGRIFNRDYWSVVDVAKKNIGTWRGIDFFFSNFLPVTYHDNSTGFTTDYDAMMWNTYERDWWEGKKYIASVNGFDIQGRMTFDNETFFYKREDAHQNSYWFMDQDASDRIWNNGTSQTNMNGYYQSEMNVERK